MCSTGPGACCCLFTEPLSPSSSHLMRRRGGRARGGRRGETPGPWGLQPCSASLGPRRQPPGALRAQQGPDTVAGCLCTSPRLVPVITPSAGHISSLGVSPRPAFAKATFHMAKIPQTNPNSVSNILLSQLKGKITTLLLKKRILF